MIAFFLGTFFGFTVAAIFSARAYDKGYRDALKLEREGGQPE
jgi:hypothetical protein